MKEYGNLYHGGKQLMEKKYKKIGFIKVDGDFRTLLFDYFVSNNNSPIHSFADWNQKIGILADNPAKGGVINQIVDLSMQFGVWLERNKLIKKVTEKELKEGLNENERNKLSMVG